MAAFTSLPGKVAVILVVIISTWMAGFLSGRLSGKVEQLADTVEAFQKRGKIDAAVGGKSDFELCIALGGLPDKCNELRRVDEPAGSE